MPRDTTFNRTPARPFTSRRAYVRVPAHSSCAVVDITSPLIRPRRACARIQVLCLQDDAPVRFRRCLVVLALIHGICEQRAVLANLSRPTGRPLPPPVRTVRPESIPVLLAAASARIVPTASPTVLSGRALAPWAVQLANTLLHLLTRRKEIFPVLP